jgi:MFS family permease
MSSNVTFLAVGMLAAGRLTDSVGPRWIWGAASVLSAGAAIVGFTLARGVREQEELPTVPEPPLEAEPAIEAPGGIGRRAL